MYTLPSKKRRFGIRPMGKMTLLDESENRAKTESEMCSNDRVVCRGEEGACGRDKP